MRPRIVRLLLILTLLPGIPISTRADNSQLRQTMNEVFDAIAYLLPLSLRAGDTVSQTDQELIGRYLGVLASSDKALSKHAEALDPEFQMLSRSFDRAVERVSYSFQGESYIDAYFALSDMAQNCVACHSRLPDDSDFLLGQKLFARMDVGALEPEDIAQLYIATRQFRDALRKLEEVILDESVSPFDLDLDGTLIEYLQIGITVTRDLDRVRRTLDLFIMRGDVPLYIGQHVSVWNAGIDGLAEDLGAEPTLQRAREVFHQATGLTLAPAGRERAVHDIVAAAILRRFLERGGGAPEQISEAYYLLGVIALRTLRTRSAVPEMEFMLESSIRAAPKSPFAAAAYRMLEEFSYTNYVNFGARELLNPNVEIRELYELIKP